MSSVYTEYLKQHELTVFKLIIQSTGFRMSCVFCLALGSSVFFCLGHGSTRECLKVGQVQLNA